MIGLPFFQAGISSAQKIISDLAQTSTLENFTSSLSVLCWYPVVALDAIEAEYFDTQQELDIFRENIDEKPSKVCNWDALNIDVGTHILSFLEPRDVCSLDCADNFSHSIVSKARNKYWDASLMHRFSLAVSNSSQYEYLRNHNKYLERELNHLSTAFTYYDAICRFSTMPNSSGFIGMLCDLAWVDNVEVAMALSRKRYMTMSTIVMRTNEDILAFKKISSKSSPSCAGHPSMHSSFITLENLNKNGAEDVVQAVQTLSQDIHFPGFLGFAVNLLHFHPHLEYLRHSLYWSVFRDLMVFETRVAKLEYKSLLDPVELKDFWGVALDDFSPDMLEKAQPSLSSSVSRDLDFIYSCPPSTRLPKLERQLTNGRISEAFIRYTY